MLKILTGSDHAELEAAYRFRHQIFVEESGWQALRKPDGLERDEFDGNEAVHFLVYEGDELIAYQRMLPTTKPYLLTTVYPHLSDVEAPSDPSVYEWTRCAVRHDRRGEGRSTGLTSLELALGLVEWGLSCGVTSVVVELEPIQMLKFAQCHFRAYPLGVTHEMEGKEVVALHVYFDERTRMRLKGVIAQMKMLRRAS